MLRWHAWLYIKAAAPDLQPNWLASSTGECIHQFLEHVFFMLMLYHSYSNFMIQSYF